jgi:hypothetical protein
VPPLNSNVSGMKKQGVFSTFIGLCAFVYFGYQLYGAFAFGRFSPIGRRAIVVEYEREPIFFVISLFFSYAIFIFLTGVFSWYGKKK